MSIRVSGVLAVDGMTASRGDNDDDNDCVDFVHNYL